MEGALRLNAASACKRNAYAASACKRNSEAALGIGESLLRRLHPGLGSTCLVPLDALRVRIR